MSGMAVSAPSRTLVYRHHWLVRLWHWINVVCIVVLLMSGLQIFNAHPALYWGQASTFDDPALSIGAARGADGRVVGITRIGDATFETTGVLGYFRGDGGYARAFSRAVTLPSWQDLATGRRWHFFFAWLFVLNGSAYLIYALASRHAWRDLVPSRRQVRHIGRTILDHVRLRFPRGEEALHYNVLQQFAYLLIAFVVLPLVVLTGLTMSPGMNAAVPWLVDVFGGRQSARTIHFIAAALIVLFTLVHVVMMLVSGPWNNLRAMVTGRYAIRRVGGKHES